MNRLKLILNNGLKNYSVFKKILQKNFILKKKLPEPVKELFEKNF